MAAKPCPRCGFVEDHTIRNMAMVRWNRHGMKKSEIAEMCGISYQRVRETIAKQTRRMRLDADRELAALWIILLRHPELLENLK